MRNNSGKNRLYTGVAPGASSVPAMTLLEMIIAMVIMSIVFAAVLPQFRAINNSWNSKQGNAELLQNGRVLTDHINRNLLKAVRITAVSDSTETNGYIQFLDNDGNNLRYEITDGYVQFGTVGSLSDLAGPVSQLQFICYDACDLDTPLDISTTDVNSIRFVQAQTILTNSASLGRDRTFITQAYLRANADIGAFAASLGEYTAFEYDISKSLEPALTQIDDNHFLCAYSGSGDVGLATILTVDTETWAITQETSLVFDTSDGETPALAEIDSTHYLCAYTGTGKDGWAVVLTVNTGTWTITKETPFEYETTQATTPALAKIDDSHYLCAYTDKFSDGQAVVLTVNTGTWNITAGTPIEYDTSYGKTPALIQIDSTHYLCAYEGSGDDGWAVVLTVNTGTWNITAGTPIEYDTNNGQTPALLQIDNTHYLCAYVGSGNDGWAVVLTVDTGTWTITKGTAFEYDAITGLTPALAQIDPNNYLCAYQGSNNVGCAVVLTVDTNTWTITKGTTTLEHDSTCLTPALAQIDPNEYLCAYNGQGDDGWSVVLDYTPAGVGQILP